eukprot:CAMPEP_0171063680 /NCGR_PEP_ID=MMETSP0766_2-20121228/5816_1 /TAXON_ID=439317 /ORGANISM="Gambierdiscus australes, Strain CAWD 149" /LENGTH=426 /DNA_ID=CAMNT_0011519623 /DNA_START=25 /DNA_END=1305 /DNA_ORIENTATION=-
MRGVSPELKAKYDTGPSFKCFDSGSEVPLSAVNDDFCDCADGSDEPGTGACAGQDSTLFHCANDGATPQLVYASRVDDGICDCCDGSDEEGLAARRPGHLCANRCAEEGQKDLQDRADRIQRLKEGLEKKAQIISAAESDRSAWSQELGKLQAELPGLEAALEVAKQSEAAKAGSSAATDVQAEVAELKRLVAELQAEVATLKAKLKALQPEEASVAAPAVEEKPVVSEYAKWMEGAGSTPGAVDAPSEEEEEGTGAAYDTEDDSPGPLKPTPGSSTKAPAVTEAENKVRENKDTTKKLQKKLGQLSGDQLGFSSLLDKCVSKHDGQYDYKICFFDDAKQDSVLLGRWKAWVGPKQASFSDGHMCPGGPARELNVFFECGSAEEVLDVSEPSRCSYQAHVAHPGACVDADMAALEKPPVKHPKDEL